MINVKSEMWKIKYGLEELIDSRPIDMSTQQSIAQF